MGESFLKSANNSPGDTIRVFLIVLETLRVCTAFESVFWDETLSLFCNDFYQPFCLRQTQYQINLNNALIIPPLHKLLHFYAI